MAGLTEVKTENGMEANANQVATEQNHSFGGRGGRGGGSGGGPQGPRRFQQGPRDDSRNMRGPDKSDLEPGGGTSDDKCDFDDFIVMDEVGEEEEEDSVNDVTIISREGFDDSSTTNITSSENIVDKDKHSGSGQPLLQHTTDNIDSVEGRKEEIKVESEVFYDDDNIDKSSSPSPSQDEGNGRQRQLNNMNRLVSHLKTMKEAEQDSEKKSNLVEKIDLLQDMINEIQNIDPNLPAKEVIVQFKNVVNKMKEVFNVQFMNEVKTFLKNNVKQEIDNPTASNKSVTSSTLNPSTNEKRCSGSKEKMPSVETIVDSNISNWLYSKGDLLSTTKKVGNAILQLEKELSINAESRSKDFDQKLKKLRYMLSDLWSVANLDNESQRQIKFKEIDDRLNKTFDLSNGKCDFISQLKEPSANQPPESLEAELPESSSNVVQYIGDKERVPPLNDLMDGSVVRWLVSRGDGRRTRSVARAIRGIEKAFANAEDSETKSDLQRKMDILHGWLQELWGISHLNEDEERSKKFFDLFEKMDNSGIIKLGKHRRVPITESVEPKNADKVSSNSNETGDKDTEQNADASKKVNANAGKKKKNQNQLLNPNTILGIFTPERLIQNELRRKFRAMNRVLGDMQKKYDNARMANDEEAEADLEKRMKIFSCFIEEVKSFSHVDLKGRKKKFEDVERRIDEIFNWKYEFKHKEPGLAELVGPQYRKKINKKNVRDNEWWPEYSEYTKLRKKEIDDMDKASVELRKQLVDMRFNNDPEQHELKNYILFMNEKFVELQNIDKIQDLKDQIVPCKTILAEIIKRRNQRIQYLLAKGLVPSVGMIETNTSQSKTSNKEMSNMANSRAAPSSSSQSEAPSSSSQSENYRKPQYNINKNMSNVPSVSDSSSRGQSDNSRNTHYNTNKNIRDVPLAAGSKRQFDNSRNPHNINKNTRDVPSVLGSSSREQFNNSRYPDNNINKSTRDPSALGSSSRQQFDDSRNVHYNINKNTRDVPSASGSLSRERFDNSRNPDYNVNKSTRDVPLALGSSSRQQFDDSRNVHYNVNKSTRDVASALGSSSRGGQLENTRNQQYNVNKITTNPTRFESNDRQNSESKDNYDQRGISHKDQRSCDRDSIDSNSRSGRFDLANTPSNTRAHSVKPIEKYKPTLVANPVFGQPAFAKSSSTLATVTSHSQILYNVTTAIHSKDVKEAESRKSVLYSGTIEETVDLTVADSLHDVQRNNPIESVYDNSRSVDTLTSDRNTMIPTDIMTPAQRRQRRMKKLRYQINALKFSGCSKEEIKRLELELQQLCDEIHEGRDYNTQSDEIEQQKEIPNLHVGVRGNVSCTVTSSSDNTQLQNQIENNPQCNPNNSVPLSRLLGSIQEEQMRHIHSTGSHYSTQPTLEASRGNTEANFNEATDNSYMYTFPMASDSGIKLRYSSGENEMRGNIISYNDYLCEKITKKPSIFKSVPFGDDTFRVSGNIISDLDYGDYEEMIETARNMGCEGNEFNFEKTFPFEVDEGAPGGGRGGNPQGGGGRGGHMGGRGGFRGQNRGPLNNDERGGGGRGQDERLNEKLMGISGPTVDLPPQDTKEKKFTGRCRLYIGNLSSDAAEEELNEMFGSFGETAETFVNKEKNFAFIRLDYRANAEKAKRELDGTLRKGRPIKVRFAPLGAAVKVKNLTSWVSNELLECAFSVFGEIERAVIITDERGNSQKEGIIEFARKPSAQLALRRCNEGCFFLTSSLRPVILEPYEPLDDIDGYPEKNLPKKNPEYYKSREIGPRFASVGGFEFEYGTRWKQLHELYKQKEEALTREMKMEEEKLEAQMEYARYEHETEILREQLRQRELDRERQKREWELKERQAEDQRRADEDMMRRQQEEMQLRMHHQEDELRRRQQENSIFMQEQAMRQSQGGNYSTPPVQESGSMRDYEAMAAAAAAGGAGIPADPKAYMEAYERGARYDSARGGMDEARRGEMPPRGRWGPPADRRVPAEDYPQKRRRY